MALWNLDSTLRFINGTVGFMDVVRFIENVAVRFTNVAEEFVDSFSL